MTEDLSMPQQKTSLLVCGDPKLALVSREGFQ